MASAIVVLIGARIFPGVHNRATFDITDTAAEVRISIRSEAGDMHVVLRGNPATDLPSNSAFPSLEAASEFFRGGSVGYSPGRDRGRLGGLKLITPTWRVEPLAGSEVHSSWLEDQPRFPSRPGNFEFRTAMPARTHRLACPPPPRAGSSTPDGWSGLSGVP